MKVLGLAIFVLALAAGLAFYLWSSAAVGGPAAPPAPPGPAAIERASLHEPDAPSGALHPPDSSAELLARLDKVIARLERLETSVSEVRTEVSIRSEERSRVPVLPPAKASAAELSEDDLAQLRKLIHDAQVAEAWRARQQELVDLGRRLAHELPIESRHVDSMIEVLCSGGLALFNVEQDLMDSNHDRTLARRRAADLRLARRKLREDLGSVVRNEDAASRIFLAAVGGTAEDPTAMDGARLALLEKEWLK